MNTSLTQTVGITQKLNMTQAMKQSLNLLNYSTEELHTFLKEKMDEDPFLHVRLYEPFVVTSSQHTIDLLSDSISKENLIKQRIWEQLSNKKMNLHVKDAIDWLLNDLNELGLLPMSITEYAQAMERDEKIVKQAIELIQQCEPIGIGAPSIMKALYSQAKMKELPEYVLEILSTYFELFIDRKWEQIKREAGFSLKEIQLAADYISKLNTSPLQEIVEPDVIYIKPDAEIRKSEEGFQVLFYKHAFPDVMISQEFIESLSLIDPNVRAHTEKCIAEVETIRAHLVNRKITIKTVIEQIVHKQHRFFGEGEKAILPFTIRELASQMGVHESTVSRAIREKYIHTPFGTVALRSFFIQPTVKSESGTVSPNIVKEKLKAIIKLEDKRKPISDQNIAGLLKKEGIELSRRVITKYREQLMIPASTKRRRFD